MLLVWVLVIQGVMVPTTALRMSLPPPGTTVLMNASAASRGNIPDTQLPFKVWW